jgi:hypothetical protein
MTKPKSPLSPVAPVGGLATALVAALAAFVVVVAPATQARAQAQLQQVAADADAKNPPLPVRAWVGLTQNVGSGTFVTSPGNPTTSTTLSLTPMLVYQGWQFILRQSFGFEWTQSDGNTTANQIELSDLTLGARNMSSFAIKDAKLVFWPSVGLSLPLSMRSRQAGQLAGLTGGARANWGVFDDVGVTFFGGLNGGYNILVPSLANRFASQPVRPLNDRLSGPIAVVSCNPRNAQELSNYVCSDGQIPAVASWGASAGMWWFYLLDGNLGASINVGYQQSFSARVGPDDEFTADNAVAGLVPRQSTSGDVSVTYIPFPWVWLTAGAGSGQPFLSADGKGVRFPLWDFVSPYNNFSSLYLDATFIL